MFSPFLWDSSYLLLIIVTTAISLAAQFWVRSAYGRWSQVRNSNNVTGAQAAQIIIDRTPVGDVVVNTGDGPRSHYSQGIRLERVAGQMTDHYDPQTHTVRMSEQVAAQPSVASMAIVAHELGHAQQHEENSVLIQLRNFLIPAVTISPQVAIGLILMGVLFQTSGLLWLGIIFFGLTVVFVVLTLPVEFDASRRGLLLLEQSGLFGSEEDREGARSVLTAAGMTYVAAAVTAILQLLYYVSLAQRSRD